MLAQRSETNSRARNIFRATAILLPAFGLVAITWFGTLSAIHAQREEATARIVAQVTNQANSFQQEIHQQILDLDQTLRILVGVWETDPAKFDLSAWRDRAVALSDFSHDLLLADNHGVIVQATMPRAIGTNVSDRDYFVDALQHAEIRNHAYLGAATTDRILHQWHMNVARGLRNADGSFGGVIVADWRVSAIDDLFRAADLGSHPLMELVGLDDGRLRAVAGPVTGAPDARAPDAGTPKAGSPDAGAPDAGVPDESIADSQMFAMLRASADGVWIGRSSLGGVLRLHVFRRIAGPPLAVVVGVDLDEALAPSYAWESQARLFAGCISSLILIMGGMLLIGSAQWRQRQASLTYDRSMIAAANSQLEVAKAHADAKTAQLEATLDGMSDGVAMMDSRLFLAEWNRQFPDIAGVPPQVLRVGLPMEDILRAQVKTGQFGPVDMETEVARRMALLREDGLGGSIERTRPDGHTIELRRNPLPDGGFVTLYTDVTARKQVENALRDARAIAEAATEAKSRFVAIVSHEIRTPLNALLATLTLLHDAGLPPAQQALLDMSRQSGDALLGLINDILEMSRMEAGQLSLRPSVFALRGLLDGAIEIFRPQAAERGIVLRLAASPALPHELYADPGRLRQVLINLLSNAVKFGQPGAVGLLADQEQDANGRPVLHLAVRDRGPVIEQAGRERLFRPFSRLEGSNPGAVEQIGSGLGLAICRQLVSLMGGEIGCEPWMADDGQAGNEFWMRLPIATLPGVQQQPSGAEVPVRRILPRTRILLVDDILTNQLVTGTLLRREGHLVDIATNGAEALKAVADVPYDLVFMDVFMPGMSGFDVARQIRAMPGPAGTVPIVALTANVSPDDQALCREAGMNRSLGKPVALPDLVQALAELVWRGLPERTVSMRVAAPRPRNAVLSAERIRELRSSLPGEMLGGMVEECLVDLQARLPDLRRAMQAGSSDEVAVQAHAMVGMAAGYGMAALEARLRALMLAARGSDTARAAVLAVELDVELSMAADALREALAIEMV
ncbi:MAG TPA: PAS-domain containing protein [Acetobacteraceae bacterium]|jgi:signal transduction histidine kinase/DNA-binding NarL/FixJ family response regulator